MPLLANQPARAEELFRRKNTKLPVYGNPHCSEPPPLLPYYNYTVLMLVFRLLYTELIILFPLGSVIRICCELSLALTACPCCNVPTTYLLFHGAQLCSGFGVIFCLLYSIVAKVLLLTVFSLCVRCLTVAAYAGNRVQFCTCVGLVRHHQFYVINNMQT